MAFSFRKATHFLRRIRAACTGRGNVHFLHIRKTGGTALKSALTPFPVTPRWVIYMHPHRVTLRDVPRGHCVMFVTRDPLARYVSGFGSRLRQGAPSHNVPWTDDERIAFGHFPTPESLALALDPQHPEHERALHAMRSISHLNCYYSDWFGSEQELEKRAGDVLFIGRTESLDADFAALRAALELPGGLALPGDARAANRTSGGSAPALSARASTLLKDWYAADYRFLDWCTHWRREQGGPVARRFLPPAGRPE